MIKEAKVGPFKKLTNIVLLVKSDTMIFRMVSATVAVWHAAAMNHLNIVSLV